MVAIVMNVQKRLRKNIQRSEIIRIWRRKISMALGDGIARNKGRKAFAFQKGYRCAIDEMTDNLIRNSRTEVIDDKVCLIVTEERIKVIAEEMKKALDN